MTSSSVGVRGPFTREVSAVVERVAPDFQTVLWGHLGDGNVHVGVSKGHHLGLVRSLEELDLTCTIKTAFDPTGRMNPGVVFRERWRSAWPQPRRSTASSCLQLGTVSRSTALLVGTGTIGELTAQQLAKRGVKQLLVMGRAPLRAKRLAEAYGGHQITPASSTTPWRGPMSSLAPPVGRGQSYVGTIYSVQSRAGARTPDRLLVLDLSVPRDVDPAATGLSGVQVHTIDDLRGLARAIVQPRPGRSCRCARVRPRRRRRCSTPIAGCCADPVVSRKPRWARVAGQWRGSSVLGYRLCRRAFVSGSGRAGPGSVT